MDVKPVLGLFGRVLSEQTQCYRQFVEGLAHEEVRLRRWLRTLERNKVIPPARWFRKVPGTSPALRSAWYFVRGGDGGGGMV